MGDFDDFWKGIPFFSKVIMIISTILLILFKSGVIGPMYYFANSPHFVLELQVWRMFTTQFFEWSVWNYFLGLWMIYGSAAYYEKTIGTVAFVVDFFFSNFLIQLFHFIIIYSLSLAKITDIISPSMGLWNIGMMYMSLRCYSNPDEKARIWPFPFQIRNKYKPVFLLIFYHLLWFQFELRYINLSSLVYDFIIALLLGYISVKYFDGMIFRLSASRVESLERSFIFNSWSKRYDFAIPTNASQFYSKKSSSTTARFQGKGIAIGGSTFNPASESMTSQQLQVISPTLQSPQSSEIQLNEDFQLQAEKSVSIEGDNNKQLTVHQQRELILKKLQQQQNSTDKSDVETKDDSLFNSSRSIQIDQLIQQQNSSQNIINEDNL